MAIGKAFVNFGELRGEDIDDTLKEIRKLLDRKENMTITIKKAYFDQFYKAQTPDFYEIKYKYD